MTALLHVEGLGKRFGGFVALQEIDLEVQPGERLGLIGPNGSGKSTLVNCICGTLHNEQGSVSFDWSAGEQPDHASAHASRAAGPQLPVAADRSAGQTLAENLRIPILYTVNARGGRSLSRPAILARCLELLAHVNLADKAHRLPRDLTQIEMRKLELARAMAADPKLLIADEAIGGLLSTRRGPTRSWRAS